MRGSRLKRGWILSLALGLLGAVLMGPMVRATPSEVPPPKPLIETLLGTYLLPGQGEILGQFRLPGDAVLDASSCPVRVFGRYKKFKKGSMEVIQVIWTQLGKEKNNVLKKEKITTRIASIIPYRGSFLEKATPLDLKGDHKEFVQQVRRFAQAEDLLDQDMKQEMEEVPGSRKTQTLLPKSFQENPSTNKESEKNKNAFRSQSAGGNGPVGLYALPPPPEKEKTKEPEIRFLPSPYPPVPLPTKKVSEVSSQNEEPILEGLEVGPHLPEIQHIWERRNCEPLVDFAQGKVCIQKRKITLENHQEKEEGPCEISQERYPIKYEYRECPDLISREEGRAFRQYTRFWVDGTGQIHPLDQTCQQDENQSFLMEEDPQGCAFVPDFDTMKARPQSALVYRNHQGSRVVVENCRPTPGAFELEIQKEFKGWRHDFETSRSYKQHRFSLECGGIRHYLSPQIEDPEVYPHGKTTQTCSLFHNPTTGENYIQERLFIDTPEGPVWISQCKVGDRLIETEEGCEGLFEHDMAARSSRSYTREYYEKEGQKIYMTPCEVSTHTYRHQSRIVGYLHKDAEKNSYPTVQTFINPDRGAEVILQTVQTESPQSAVAYLLESTFKEPMESEKTFEGCFQLTPIRTVHRYKRADGSLYEEVGPERSIKKSRNLCVKEEETRTQPSSSWGLWNTATNSPRPVVNALDPRGSTSGILTCAALFARHLPHKFPNMVLRIVHTQTVEKRTKTKFPNGQIKSGEWSHVSGPHQVGSLVCQF